MPRAIVFPSGNQNCPKGLKPTVQTDVKALEMFEQKRIEVPQITNYLEALYARLLTETAGATALKVMADETRRNSTQTIYQGNADRSALRQNRKL